MQLILLILSIAPVVFFGYWIYKKDFDKEPTSILVKLFICGVLSTFLTLLITYLLHLVIPFFRYETSDLDVIELIPYVFIGVALIEEFSKWIFVYKLEYNDQEFNHLYDGIVYAAFVSLGFACFENILYVMQGGVGTAIGRAFLAIPGHLCDGIMMGYYLSMAKLALCNNNKGLCKKNIIMSLLIPTLAHGIYDYLLFASTAVEEPYSGIFVLVFFVFVIFFFVYASKKVKQLARNAYNLNPNYITINQRKQMYNNMYQQPGYPQQMYNNGYQQPGYPQQNYNNGYQQPGYPQQNYYTGYQQPNYSQQNYNNGYQQQNYSGVVIPQVQENTPKKKFCPNCGAPASGKFCSKCGNKLD